MTEIRIAGAADAEAMAGIAQNAFSHYVDRMGKQPAPMLANFDFHLRYDHCLVAVEDGHIIGYLILVLRAPEPLLDTVAVHKAHQGRGVGSLLIKEAEQMIMQAGFSSYQLYTNIHMYENIQWYKNWGFTETERREENGFMRIYMRHQLG